MSRWFASVDMDGASTAVVDVVSALERHFEGADPQHLSRGHSWIKTRGQGWPPPELVPPDLPPSALPGWDDCEIGIRIGHDTDAEADITVGMSQAYALVGCLGGRTFISDRAVVAGPPWTDEVVDLAGQALHAQYVWERHYRGDKCVRWELAYVGVHVDGTDGRHLIRGSHTCTAWLPLPKELRVERRLLTYGLRDLPH